MTFSLEGRLGLDARRFKTGADQAARSVDEIGDSFGELPDDAKKAGRGIDREFGKIGKKAGEVGQSAGSEFAGKFGKAITAAGLGALVVESFQSGLDLTRANKKLAGQFRLSADEAAKWGKVAGDNYSDGWGESLEQVGQATLRVQRDLADGNVVLVDELTEGALAIARTWDEDVSAVIRSASQLLQNDLADSGRHALDIITTGFQSGADEAGDFLDTIDEYSQHWAAAGISGEQALNQMIAGLDTGQRNMDKIGDAVKEMTLRLREGLDPARDALEAIGLNADDVVEAFREGGPAAVAAFEQVIPALERHLELGGSTTEAVEILGTQYEDLGARGLEALGSLNEQTLEVEGATADLAEAVEATDWEKFQRRAETALAKAGQGVAKVGNEIIDGVDGWFDEVGRMGDAFGGLFGRGDLGAREFNEAQREAIDLAVEYGRSLDGQVASFDEARQAALVHAAALDMGAESTDFANKAATEWAKATGNTADELANARREAQALRDAQIVNEFERLHGSASDAADSTGDAADALDDAGDAADDAAGNIDDVRTAWDKLSSRLSDRKNLLGIQTEFDRVKERAEDAWTAVAEGSDDAEQRVRDHEVSMIDLAISVGDYLSEVHELPDSVVTRIVSQVERGDLDAVEGILERLGRGVIVPVRVSTGSSGQALRRIAAPGGAAAFMHQGGAAQTFGGSPITTRLLPGEVVLPTHKQTPQAALAAIAPQAVAGASMSRSTSVTVNHYGPGETTPGAVLDAIARAERFQGAGWREQVA